MARAFRLPQLRDHHAPAQLLRLAIVIMGVAAEARRIGTILDFGGSLLLHFSYFTVQSNITVLVVTMWLIAQPPERRPAWLDSARGAATSYILLTFATYAAVIDPGSLLRFDVSFTNIIQHRVVPALVLIDWLLIPGARRIPVVKAWRWMLYPIVYAVAASIVATAMGAWLYGFLNPVAQGGWGGVILSTGGVLLVTAAITAAVALTSRSKRGTTAETRAMPLVRDTLPDAQSRG